VPLVEQELLTLPEHLSSSSVFSGGRVTRSLVLYACFVDRCLSFCTFVCSSSIYEFWLPLLVSSNSSYIVVKLFIWTINHQYWFIDFLVYTVMYTVICMYRRNTNSSADFLVYTVMYTVICSADFHVHTIGSTQSQWILYSILLLGCLYVM
jgi:hypothetical protein